MVRDRISLGNDEVRYILKGVYLELIKLAAPFIPYTTERVWQDLREKRIVKEESVHLSDWPKADDKKIDIKLEEEMQEVLKIIEKGMAERDNLKIGLKWPLSKAKITCKEKLKDEMLEIIKRQLNVKKAEIKKGGEIAVELDTKMTPELEAEGYAREIIRRIQDARKKAGLQKHQKIDLLLLVDKNMKTGLQKHREMLAERANAKNFEIKDIVDKTAVLGKYRLTIEADIRNKKIIFGFNIL